MSSFTEARFEQVAGKYRDPWKPWGVTLWPGRPVYRVVGGFWFYIGAPHPTRGVEVPDGFETDFASIPLALLILLWLFGLLGWVTRQLAVPSILHDFCRERLEFALMDGDCLYLMAMSARRVHPVVRWAAFLAVRTNTSRIQHNAAA